MGLRQGVALAGHQPPCQHRQLQAGNPALGLPRDIADLLFRQVERLDAGQVIAGLVQREAQIGCLKLQQTATGPQPGEREGRFDPACHRQREVLGQGAQQQVHVAVDRRVTYRLVVVQKQHDGARSPVQAVQQNGQGVAQCRRRSFHHSELFGETGRRRFQRVRQVGQEVPVIMAAAMQRQPAGDHAAILRDGVPAGEQGGFADPSRSRQSRQTQPVELIDTVFQPQPKDQGGLRVLRTQIIDNFSQCFCCLLPARVR